jgi:hypothetical protein
MANTAKTELRPPSGLGAEGRRLWRDIVRDAAGQGLVLDARELHWLQSAGSLADRIAVLEATVDGADLIVKGVAGQPVAHPLLAEIRLHRELLARTLARLRTDVPKAPSLPVGTGNRFRHAAMARWHPSGI